MSTSSAAMPVAITRTAPRVLIIAPHGSYRTFPYIAAAQRLGVRTVIASEGKHSIISAYAQGLHVDFAELESAIEQIRGEARREPFVGVIGTDDATTELAATIAELLNLPHNDPAAVRIARRKDLARDALATAAVPKPAHWHLDLTQPIATQLNTVRYPVVVKPIALSASRGVIRADNAVELDTAIVRIRTMLQRMPDLEPIAQQRLLIEEFIAGQEVAIEGMLTGGELAILAIFDKPDPLNGPFFEETYYITPSRWPAAIQQQMAVVVAQVCQAYGLREGPVHAECRINDQGVFVLEVAARTIGGMCSRLLRFGTGFSLEELVLAQAMGRSMTLSTEQGAAGVLMIPIPQAGVLKRVEGILAAQQTPFIEEIDIQVRDGHELIPLPEGSSYLGFIFARAPTPAQAEQALRAAQARLNFVVAPVWKITKAS